MEVLTKSLIFKPRARLIRTVGDRLISGPEAAIIELVKNGYDADAKWVRITFTPPLTPGEGSIVVEDNGHGMTIRDIEENWMEPATTDKIDRIVSKGGRTFLGSKGIGRFAAARLGRWLDVETTAESESKAARLETVIFRNLDWNLFDEIKYLEDVSFSYEILNTGEEKGTKFTVRELRDYWTRKRLEELHNELRRMLLPVELGRQEDFKIYLDLTSCTKSTCGFDGVEIVNGPLTHALHADEAHRVVPFPLLKACDYEVEGHFDDEGEFRGTIAIHRAGQEAIPIHCSMPQDVEAGEAPCGHVLVHLFIFDRETDALRGTMQRVGMGQITAKEARRILDQIAGVAIYRERFRIRPYGDPENDWLTLDKLRVNNPTVKIGHNQVSGMLLIDSEECSHLIERSSREGLEENGSYFRFRRLIQTLFAQEIEPRRYKFRQGAEIGRRRVSTFRNARLAAEFKWFDQYIDSMPLRIREEAKEAFVRESSRLIGLLDELEQKHAALEAQVTLGRILAEVLHEGNSPVAYLQEYSNRLLRWWPKLLGSDSEAHERRERLPQILRQLVNSASKLRDLFRALQPLAGGKRGKPIYYNPTQIVLDVKQIFESRYEEAGITVKITAPPEIKSYCQKLCMG